ncbi:hypothetical protein [Rhizobium leguminosarum]|uniref:hypothetical protein n=1 Tax=Rhizobium leguminosarum TaxID=384 RepID=UPI001C90B569|nr:hypothetical protein [Rhizobium leguminosarum]MBY2986409.1 hypothetical protein [Rhizobium leguminosarum]
MTVEAQTIPEDILAAATAVEDEIMAADLHDIDTQIIIAKAIMAERERCARIAEGRSKSFDFQKALADHDDMAYGANTSRSEIALAIRGEA